MFSLAVHVCCPNDGKALLSTAPQASPWWSSWENSSPASKSSCSRTPEAKVFPLMLSYLLEGSQKRNWFLATEAKGRFTFWKGLTWLWKYLPKWLGAGGIRPGRSGQENVVQLSEVQTRRDQMFGLWSSSQFSKTRPEIGHGWGTNSWPRGFHRGKLLSDLEIEHPTVHPFVKYPARGRKLPSLRFLMRSTGLVIWLLFLGSGPCSGKPCSVWLLENHSWQLLRPCKGYTQLKDHRPNKKLEGRWTLPSSSQGRKGSLGGQVTEVMAGKSGLSGR